ncbi:hypothetical protein ANCCEY_06828 [Ancylostoma ceylanicum]|uniref:Mos1 transposase HTH domain-containing protein n=1 Tax=Ancylostoma ceylanicum TaxID=53326 RepID=A0A0D6LVI7_9BILA|nr:hypothetical protein ANCCEY_06828 [Ancylostoma ceylanicum]
MSDQKDRLRVRMLYDFKQGKTAAESHRSLCHASGEDVISERQCGRWFERFRNGDESLKDEDHLRGSHVVDSDALKGATESDPCQTAYTSADVDVWPEDYRQPLTDAIKAARVSIAGVLLRLAKNSGFYGSIVTSDEKWIQYNNVNRKRQWLGRGEEPRATPKPDTHGKRPCSVVGGMSEVLCAFGGANSKSGAYSRTLRTTLDPYLLYARSRKSKSWAGKFYLIRHIALRLTATPVRR